MQSIEVLLAGNRRNRVIPRRSIREIEIDEPEGSKYSTLLIHLQSGETEKWVWPKETSPLPPELQEAVDRLSGP